MVLGVVGVTVGGGPGGVVFASKQMLNLKATCGHGNGPCASQKTYKHVQVIGSTSVLSTYTSIFCSY